MIESEKREGEMTNKVEKEKPSEKNSKASEASFWTFFEGFSFATLLATPSSFFQIRSSLSSLVLPCPLHSSPLSCMIFSPCRPDPVPGTWCGIILERFCHHSLSPNPVKCSSGLKISAEGVGSGVIRATNIWTDAIPYNHHTGVEWGHSLKFAFKYFWNYFEAILNLFWVNVKLLWDDHFCMIFGPSL